MSESAIIPLFLLLLFGTALSVSACIIALAVREARRRLDGKVPVYGPLFPPSRMPAAFFRRPDRWLAVKSRNPRTVQLALGLHNAQPCSWYEGLASEEKLFIGPPVKGWILVTGAGVPDPLEDVDACFRRLMYLSRKLGEVQLFSSSRILHYHAWARVERGKVRRAYAWAGRTLWKQGRRTLAEKELRMRCFDYAEPAERAFGEPDVVVTNVDKLPLLAARWSFDPAHIEQPVRATGIVGEPSLCY